MAGKTLKDFNVPIDIIKQKFDELTSNVDNDDIKLIFEVAIKDMDNFPNGKGLGAPLTYEEYLKAWINSYIKAINNPPSSRIAKPKTSCDDPSVKELVKTIKNLNDSEIALASQTHNLFMSAENIQGGLLEEFISKQIRKYGWLWCVGSTIHAVDFCTIDGSFFLQIKNKNITENSSSSTIRNGTQIKKWYRLKSVKINGIITPHYMWDNLNKIVNEHNITHYEQKCNISEESYQAFIRKIAKHNKQIITEK